MIREAGNEGDEVLRTALAKAQSPQEDDWIDDEGVSVEDAFREAVRTALADGVVTAQEREQLMALRRDYGITNETAKRVFDEEKAASIGRQPQSISQVDTSKVGKLLQLAEKASLAGNHEESLNFCNKALEEDPQNYHAWFGKGKAVGWMSTLANFRLEEMISSFEHAVDFSPGHVRQDVRRSGAEIIADVSSTWYDNAHFHLREFAAVGNSWPEYLHRSSEARVGLRYALQVLDDPEIARKAVQICCTDIKGMQYVNFDGSAGTHSVTEEYELLIRRDMQDFVSRIQRHIPSYKPPEVTPIRSQCFVITASMGCPDDPAVLLLRSFRDDWLQHRNWGKAAISLYWRVGPVIANLIRGNPWRMAFARAVVVCPAVAIASAILFLQKHRQN